MSPNIAIPRRALSILALLVLVLVPLQGSIQSAPSAAADTSRAARTPKVFMKLDKHQVTTKQRAQVKIALSLHSARSQEPRAQRSPGFGTGRVKVAIKGGGNKSKQVSAKLVKGKAAVRLPKLRRGIYQVRATFLGNALLGKARSEIRTLKVVGLGGAAAAGCAASAANVPDGTDGKGGCFPGTANTGPNAAASSMATYGGSCTITAANTVIDSKVVNCRSIDVRAAGFVLKNSYLNGGIVQSGGSASFTVQDSFIDSGVQFPACSNGSCPAGKYACGDTGNATTDCGVTGSNFTILRTEIINSNRAAYCEAPGPCLIQDSYFHGTNLWPDASNLAHASSVREEQNLTLRHNSLHCSYAGPFVNGDIGCATTGKPFSGDPTNGTNQKFTNNVFQRGTNKKCGDYGAVTSFNSSGTGNVWSGNVWDDGTAVAAAN
jgi:hypothetical protein